MVRTIVVAIGGNSLIKDKDHERIADQYEACVATCNQIAPLLEESDLRLVITHGNGPQVGFILRRSELAA
ncbi:MAG TPA: carbamate kinase, partial [Thermoanaerobaculia bacterium]|nr:carbamate kinase [Thermoanaerobaculia bacterium]